jgi:hydrogenase maturation protease
MSQTPGSSKPSSRSVDAPVLVLGLGNDILCDDAIGLLILRNLKKHFGKDPRFVFEETCEMGLALLDFIVGYSSLVLIDAVQIREHTPGHLYELDAQDLKSLPAFSPHFLGVGEMLGLGDILGMEMPRQVTVFAIEVSDPLTVTTRMTPALESRFPSLIEDISRRLDEIAP